MADVERPGSVAERVLMIASTRGATPNEVAIAAVLRQWREDIRRQAFEEAAECCERYGHPLTANAVRALGARPKPVALGSEPDGVVG